MTATLAGRRAGRLLGVAGLLFGAFVVFVASGQRGGETFLSNPSLSITMLGAAAMAVAAGGFGVRALIHHDRSDVVFAAIAVATVVILWATAELAFPH